MSWTRRGCHWFNRETRTLRRRRSRCLSPIDRLIYPLCQSRWSESGYWKKAIRVYIYTVYIFFSSVTSPLTNYGTQRWYPNRNGRVPVPGWHTECVTRSTKNIRKENIALNLTVLITLRRVIDWSHVFRKEKGKLLSFFPASFLHFFCNFILYLFYRYSFERVFCFLFVSFLLFPILV